MIDRRTVLGASALGAVAAASKKTPVSAATASRLSELAPPDPTETIRLWPDGAPGGEGVTVTPVVTERSTDPAYHDRFARWTTDPILTVLRPETPNGASLLLIPGGGYKWSVVDKEGLECARPLAAAGVTCFILRYRLPADGWAAGPNAPLQDAQRAMRLIRADAVRTGLDPNRVAALGASAGGHLGGLLTARADATYEPVDEADTLKHRPDLTILMYPVATMADPQVHAGSRTELLGATPTPDAIKAWSLEEMDWTGAPPMFLIHAFDDTSVVVENSLNLLTRLRRDGVKVETHLLEEGGHGFGVRLIAGKPGALWPDYAIAWGERHQWGAA